ncbi:hypothetical protein SAMN02799622_05574 [Methylobacterium sp. UNC378MF]|uniref:hypothetical protein n=1 Tax=Methylobacterium sp. UNC378MF TaxID=1502748 RepID=UPI000885178A|nr:hypothetical protein [Methylobacterium sp. UNC378MF]SDA33622.1 hypothetical protein SAMN02799622_05574 [Methylobacterium sp. UNC378MF]
MSTSDLFLYEFLYRGRPPGDPQPPAWHVVLAQVVTLPGGGPAQVVASVALSPTQAEAAGFPLPALLSAIDGAVLADRDAKAAALSKVEADLDALRGDLAAVTAERDQLRDATRPA